MATELNSIEGGPPASDLAVIGRNVYLLRHDRPVTLSQKGLAKAAGVSIGTIQNIEDARKPNAPENYPQLDTLIKIARGLGVPTARLFQSAMPSYRSGKRKSRPEITEPRQLPMVTMAR